MVVLRVESMQFKIKYAAADFKESNKKYFNYKKRKFLSKDSLQIIKIVAIVFALVTSTLILPIVAGDGEQNLNNEPPYPPTEPSPVNGATGVELDSDLSWTGGDPDPADTVTYHVFFGQETFFQLVGTVTEEYFNLGLINPPVEYNTEYKWQIRAFDNNDAEMSGPVWEFTTLVSNPPYTPSDPSPAHFAVDIAIDVDLSWTGGDPDGDSVTYDVYFGSTPPITLVDTVSVVTYDPGILAYNTIYYWRLVARDEHGVTSTGGKWHFTTISSVENNPPDVPSNPSPAHGATGIDLDTALSWTGGDPDGDPVTYCVYFGTSDSPPNVVDNQSSTTYSISNSIAYNTTYYWKIVAWDNQGMSSASSIWQFTTKEETMPSEDELVITAPTSVDEGDNFVVTITADNNPVDNVKITFSGITYYTDTLGQASLTAPLVDKDDSYLITATKTGYQQSTKWVSIKNKEETLPTIQLISPHGGETWENSQNIEWAISSLNTLVDYAVTIQLRNDDDIWLTIAEDIDITSPYLWDTTTVSDGYPYYICVILKSDEDLDGIYETQVNQDTCDNAFAVANNNTYIGWIKGTVFEMDGNETVPIENAIVCIILSNLDNVITSQCTFTDENGNYTLEADIGTYTLKVGKEGYTTITIENVKVWANETTFKNITLEPGKDEESDFITLLIDEDDEIQEAIETGKIGAKVILPSKETTTESTVVSYGNEQIDITVIEIKKDSVSLLVDSDIQTGKTIVVTTGFAFNDEIVVKYDGKVIERADNFEDAIDSNDDGPFAEWYQIEDNEKAKIIISVPHYSEHIITICTLEETLSNLVSIGIYFIICMLAAIMFVGTIYLRKKL